MRRLLGAIQFLTLLPVRGSTAPPGECAAWFPLVGAGLGAAAWGVHAAARAGLAEPLAALFPLAFLLLATGALHEDGLADVSDAIRAHRPREKMLAILKDSRIGAFGAAALVMSLLVRWQAMAVLADPRGLAASGALSRMTMVVLAAASPPAGGGLGAEFVRGLTKPAVLAAMAVGAAGAAGAVGVRAGPLLLAQAVLVLAARAWFTRRLGGVNGDCLGAACVVSEMVSLVLLACPPCT